MKVFPSVLMVGAVGVMLGGCAVTPADLLRKEPVIEYSSAKEPRAVASCISKRWSEYTSQVGTNITETGYTISILNLYIGTDATASIEAEGTGSHVRYGERIASLSPAWMSEPVSDCK
jgi:starvation-inducible outer membrane lipoprotein